MFHCVFGPLLVHLCALCVPVQLYEIMMMMMMILYAILVARVIGYLRDGTHLYQHGQLVRTI